MDECIDDLNLVDLTIKIGEWGSDRKILQNSTALAQSRKTIEEVHEMIEAAARLEQFESMYRVNGAMVSISVQDELKEGLKDAIGDVFVTLVMAAHCSDLSVTDCVAQAYNEIKGRKGYLREDGVFVKEARNAD